MGIQIPNGSVHTVDPTGLEKISVAFIGSPGLRVRTWLRLVLRC